jgi:ketosteroid isomerase-like protein
MNMTEQEKNVQIVKDVFAALNRGDLQYLLNGLADAVEWQSPVTDTITEPISWAKPRRTREDVAAFFRELFAKVKLLELKPLLYTAQDDRVYVEGMTRGIVNSTGREYTSNWVMVINILHGKCTRLHHYYDTADVSKAFAFAAEVRKAA